MSEIAESFASSLSELTVNSKPHINMLTMLADDHLEFAPIITKTVLTHLQKVPPEIKLPVLYLIDSIVKNVGKAYINLFTQNIVHCFTSTFEKVDEKTREQMFKLRQTWGDVFPAKIMYALDAKVNQIDPAWPVSHPPSTVHLNPKFFKQDIVDSKTITSTIKQPELAHVESRSHHRKNKTYNPRNHSISDTARSKKQSPSSSSGGIDSSTTVAAVTVKPTPTPEQLREQMIMKQKMLLELQQQKLKLELLQTQAQLEEQQKQLERTSVNSKTSQELTKLQQMLKQEEEKLKTMSKNLKKHAQKFPNRQHIVRVTNDMKAQKNTDLSKVSSTVVPESLVKAGALLELNKDDRPKTPSKPAQSRLRQPPLQPAVEKQKVLSPADSTEEAVPPVRIAPVSSQLINAALSFGRNVRDPRIRQMSSRLESQLNTGPPAVPSPAPQPPSHSLTVPPRKPEAADVPDSRSSDKNKKDRKSGNHHQHHRDKPSKHSEEENKPRSSSRNNEKSSSRSREKDKEKLSPKRSEEKISISRRAKIEELFSNTSSKPTTIATSSSSSVPQSPSKSNLKRDQSSRKEIAELTTIVSKSESSPKRIKFQDMSQEKSDSVVDTKYIKDIPKLELDTTKASNLVHSVVPVPKVSPEPIDGSADMLDEDIEKIVKHPGTSKIKQPEIKQNSSEMIKTESQGSLKLSDDSTEDNFDEIVKHPSKQMKLDKGRIVEGKQHTKPVTIEIPSAQKKDEIEPLKQVLSDNVPSIPLSNNDHSLKNDLITEPRNSEKQSASILENNINVNQAATLVQTGIAKDPKVSAIPEPFKGTFQEDSVGMESKLSFQSSGYDQVSSTVDSSPALDHNITESYNKEKVAKMGTTVPVTDSYVCPDVQETNQPQLPKVESVAESCTLEHLPTESEQLKTPEAIESSAFKTAERIQSPVRNVEPMETIDEQANITSVSDHLPKNNMEVIQESPPTVHQEKRFRKGDKPSIMEQVIADAERHEASPSPPPPPAISDKFKEIKQSSLIRLRRVGRSREDLIGEDSPEPVDVDLRTQIPPPLPSLTNDLKNEVLGLAEKDVDLRNLPPSPTKKRPSMEKLLDIPPAKKSKAEVMDELFGSEDVDLRPVLCPPPPSPPPPPIISTSPPPEAAGERLWARYKQNKPDTYKVKYTPSRRDRTPSVDKFGRNSRLSGCEGRWVGSGRVRSTEDVDMRAPPLTPDGSYNHIILQAFEQHNRGDLDANAYKRVLSEVFAMREKQQLEEAQRRDEEAQAELEPISDDEISGSLSGVEDAPSPPESYSGGEDIDESDFKESTAESRQELRTEEHDSEVAENINDIDIRLLTSDMDIRFKGHQPQLEEDEKHVEEKSSREDRDVSPYSRRSGVSEKEKYRNRKEELRAQRREKKSKRLEEERESRYRQSRYGQEAWVPPESQGEEEQMEVDSAPRVPPIPHYMHPPQIDSPPQVPPVRPPWEPPQRMPVPAPAHWIPGMPPVLRGPPPVIGMRPPQDRFMAPRWHQPGPGPIFEGETVTAPRFNRFTLPPMGRLPVPLPLCEVPPTDQAVLKAIEEDPTRSINIDRCPRDVRFYGITAVAFMSWDDPREISFQPGSRRVIIDDRDSVVVHFGGPPVEMIIDGKLHRIRFGAPTRELFIDNQWYELFFGGPPVTCNIAGTHHTVQLEGPPPVVRTGAPRRDLVVGKITLIIDAESYFTIYLDAKPQKFEVKGVGYIIRFVEALQKTVINGVPFKSDFGGLPRPIILNGNKHFFRLTALPRGVTPGFLTIANMEGGRLPSPPGLPAPPQLPASLEQAVMAPSPVPALVTAPPRVSPEMTSRDLETGALHPALTMPPVSSAPLVTTQPPAPVPVVTPAPSVNQLDMLTTLIPAAEADRLVTDYSYSVDNENSNQTSDLNKSSVPATSSGGEINVTELLQKLMATGIVPSLDTPKEKGQDKPPTNDSTLIKPVDFRRPETLKVRQPALITHLYTGIQCNSCGVRFPPEQTMKYSQHLDWHFRQNRRDKDSSRTAQTRRYYYDVSDWIQFEEIEDLEERAQPWFEMQEGAGEEEEPERVIVSVRAADYPDEAACHICQDKFESFYNEEKEEWHLRNAADHEGKLVHPICLEDQKAAAEKPIVVDDIDITEDEPKVDESTTEDKVKQKEGGQQKEDEDDDIMEVVDIEFVKPVFPVEDLTVSDTEDNEEKEEAPTEPKEDNNIGEELSKEITSTTNELEDTTKDEAKDDEPVEAEPKGESENPEAEVEDDEDTQDDLVMVDKGEDSVLSNAEIMEVVRNIKKDPDALGGEYEETGLDDDIKKEKGEVPLPQPVVDTTHTTVTCLIDGNVEFEEPTQKVTSGPPKIKINISKVIQPASKDNEAKEDEVTEAQSDSNIPTPLAATLAFNTQPPPPGEEPIPLKVKERLVGRKMVDLPLVQKGNEMSGLCSIM